MSGKTDIGIFCGDQRQVFMAKTFLQMGHRVFCYRIAEVITHENCFVLDSLDGLFKKCSLLIGPIPLTKDSELTVSVLAELLTKEHFLIAGMIPDTLTEVCANKGISYYDLMKNEKITVLNAVATAEGTIMEAIRASSINLHNSNCLILGYGRCAKILAHKLKGLDAIVTVAARSEDALAMAESSGFQTIYLSDMHLHLPIYNFIFNTIPALILDRNCLALVKQDITIVDIASAPGGLDYEYALQRNLNAKLCLGLPGKVSPKASADILANKIISLMKEGIK